MRRLLLYLPYCTCLLLAPSPPQQSSQAETPQHEDMVQVPLERWTTAAYTVGAPAGQPWLGLIHLGLLDTVQVQHLIHDDPLGFLEYCVLRYRLRVQGYTCILYKREFLDGKLQPAEETRVFFREEPFSVLMIWLKGARLAKGALYVEGENKGKVKIVDTIIGRVNDIEVNGKQASRSGRYFINEFGILKGSERILKRWYELQKHGELRVEYLGERTLPEVGNRLCHVFRRIGYPPEGEDDRPDEHIRELTIYIDRETFLQVGSILRGHEGTTGDDDLVAEYYFRDVQLNPDFAADQFTEQALKKK